MSRTAQRVAKAILWAATAITLAAAVVAAAYRFWSGFFAALAVTMVLGFASRAYGVRLPGDNE